MADNQPADNQHSPPATEERSGCADERGFLERLWCKIDPFGSAYPIWIALLLITLIIGFALGLRFGFDIYLPGWK